MICATSQHGAGGTCGAALRNVAVLDMIVNRTSPLLGQEILEFCLTTKTQFVVAGPNTVQEMIEQMRTLSWKTRKVGDVLIFDVPEGGSLHERNPQETEDTGGELNRHPPPQALARQPDNDFQIHSMRPQ
jgi:hypothetical protein